MVLMNPGDWGKKPEDGCHGFSFDLEDLDKAITQYWFKPADDCFMNVTLDSLLQTDHVKYTWISQEKTNLDAQGMLAPRGAFVYKMKDGSLLYKNIVPADAGKGHLNFGCAKTV